MGVGNAYIGIGAAQGLSQFPEKRRQAKAAHQADKDSQREREGLEALRAFATTGDPGPMANVFNKYSGGGQVNFKQTDEGYMATGVSPTGEAYKDQKLTRDDMAARFLAWFDPKGALMGSKGEIKAVSDGTDLVEIKGGRVRSLYQNPKTSSGQESRETKLQRLLARKIPKEIAEGIVDGTLKTKGTQFGMDATIYDEGTGKVHGKLDIEGNFVPTKGGAYDTGNTLSGESAVIVEQAIDAIKRGANRKQVIDRLKKNGIPDEVLKGL